MSTLDRQDFDPRAWSRGDWADVVGSACQHLGILGVGAGVGIVAYATQGIQQACPTGLSGYAGQCSATLFGMASAWSKMSIAVGGALLVLGVGIATMEVDE